MAEFVGITGADEATARRFLASNHDSIEHAISAFFNAESEVLDAPVVVAEPPKGPPPRVPERPGKKKMEDDWEILDSSARSGDLPATSREFLPIFLSFFFFFFFFFCFVSLFFLCFR